MCRHAHRACLVILVQIVVGHLGGLQLDELFKHGRKGGGERATCVHRACWQHAPGGYVEPTLHAASRPRARPYPTPPPTAKAARLQAILCVHIVVLRHVQVCCSSPHLSSRQSGGGGRRHGFLTTASHRKRCPRAHAHGRVQLNQPAKYGATHGVLDRTQRAQRLVARAAQLAEACLGRRVLAFQRSTVAHLSGMRGLTS